MKLIPYDVKTEFERYCGADVKYVEHQIENRQMTVKYAFTANGMTRRISALMPNSTNTALRDTARRIAKSAFDDAYRLTGKRDADMKQLLQGKTV